MKINFVIGATLLLMTASCTKEIATTKMEAYEASASGGSGDSINLDIASMNNYLDGTIKNFSYIDSDSCSDDLICFIDLEFDSTGVYWFTSETNWRSFLTTNNLLDATDKLNLMEEMSDTLHAWGEDAYFLENDSFTTAFNDFFESFYGYRYDGENNFTPKAGFYSKLYDSPNYQNFMGTFYGTWPNLKNANNKTESLTDFFTCTSIFFDNKFFNKPLLWLTLQNSTLSGLRVEIDNLPNKLKNKFESKLYPC